MTELSLTCKINTGCILFPRFFKVPSESGATGSVGDADFISDEVMFHDEYDDTIFDNDLTSTQKLKTLLPRASSDDADAMVQFQQNFEERFVSLRSL